LLSSSSHMIAARAVSGYGLAAVDATGALVVAADRVGLRMKSSRCNDLQKIQREVAAAHSPMSAVNAGSLGVGAATT
jgi:hypothetical protein